MRVLRSDWARVPGGAELASAEYSVCELRWVLCACHDVTMVWTVDHLRSVTSRVASPRHARTQLGTKACMRDEELSRSWRHNERKQQGSNAISRLHLQSQISHT